MSENTHTYTRVKLSLLVYIFLIVTKSHKKNPKPTMCFFISQLFLTYPLCLWPKPIYSYQRRKSLKMDYKYVVSYLNKKAQSFPKTSELCSF